jgi:PHD/YefM family antitoxin component YafN of YafNO toxin-antitoxin module
MMSVDDYESMVETMEVLADKDLVKRIKKAEANYQAGKSIPWDKALKELDRVSS